ncbi:MAG TPA: Gfo/Idh/MocA family oxidoreductase [Chloroflexota bacterium]|nr:Gfo/Idh/MocA family oxidoreductase [Chloroflexota bacterium]
MSNDVVRIGLIGVGVGARQLLPALSHHAGVQLTAAADVRKSALEQLQADYGLKTFTSAEAMCESEAIDAVWVASPNHLHAEHAIAAAERGKHVIVSKPLAVTLEEADAMLDAADRHSVVLLAGHSQSMAPTIRRMAEIVRVGELGQLGMLHTWHFTDWMYRPRLPDELDTRRGGGPVFRQASHQVDIVRTIAGRRLRSVRAATVELDPARPLPGAYTVYIECDGRIPATIVYSGYGHFDASAFLQGTESASAASGAAITSVDEAQRKEALRYGGGGSNSLGLFGLTLVTCEHGDIRESPDGLFVYTRVGRREIPVPDEPRGTAELDELCAALRGDRPAIHDGRWGLATLEVCLAIHESARTHQEVVLQRQG